MGKFESFIGVDFWTALFVLLNTLAIFFVAKKLLFKPVHKLISDRQAEIDGLYADAQKQKEEAEKTSRELEARLQSAQSDSERILKEAINRAENKEQEILSGARGEAAAILDKAARDAEREKKQALTEARDEIASLAVSIAEKVMEKEIDTDRQESLVNEFIERLGQDK